MSYSRHVFILKTCEIYTNFYILLPRQFCITVCKWLRIYYHELKSILQTGKFTACVGAGHYELSTVALLLSLKTEWLEWATTY
jgi:hypothetical protein